MLGWTTNCRRNEDPMPLHDLDAEHSDTGHDRIGYHPASHAIQGLIQQSNAIERELARLLGVHPTDLRAVSELASGGPRTVSELGGALGASPATASAIADRLEAHGFARRERGSADRRRVTVAATPAAGRRILEHMGPLMDEADALVRALPPTEQQIIASFLAQLVAVMAEHHRAPSAQIASPVPDEEGPV